MSGYVVKPAGSDVAIEFDWRRGYLDRTELVAADLGWTILSHQSAVGDLKIVDQYHDLSRSVAVVRGGAKGRFYLLSSRIRTSRAREIDRTVVLRVAPG